MSFNAELHERKPLLPKALCSFNRDDGYKVLNLSRDFRSEDIKNYGVSFNDSLHSIIIDSIINIQSKALVKIDIENKLLQKIKLNQLNVATYKPEASVKYIRPDMIKDLQK